MYDFVGQIKAVRDVGATPGSFFCIEVEDFTAKASNTNVVSFNCSGGLRNYSGITVGAWVKIRFAIEGREYNGRRYNNLVCQRMRVLAMPDGSQDVAPPASEVVIETDAPF